MLPAGKSQKKVSKRGNKKKVIDSMAKKEWYHVRAPNQFAIREICRTTVSRTAGLKIASEGLKNRIFETSLGDLSTNQDAAFRKMKFRVEEVEVSTRRVEMSVYTRGAGGRVRVEIDEGDGIAHGAN